MVDSASDLEFPIWGLLPKQETGLISFLKKYPLYDGRDINIAILDSGVDPGAPGLQFTSTGLCKVVERFDCSGSGDVNTSVIVTPDENGYIAGLTGRLLKIPSSWTNKNNEYHIGVKNLFELYPSKLKERIEKERKETLWDPLQKCATADVTRKLQKYENSSPKKTNPNLSIDELLEKEDVEFQLDYLNNLEKKYSDVGPVCDCVVFHDGTVWKACIDTSETGDLDKGVLLGEYSKTHDFSPITEADQLNISVNVLEEGNVLEIVSLCSGHGTHVASIAAGYFPDNPEKNGVAPGAQIISLTVGDARLGSMETGTALVRAMIKVMELQKTRPIHVINMSYGEHAKWSNSGRVIDLMTEVVNKYGVIWVASAGNHGPALCTVGTPPDITQTVLIGVGAYVSSEMMVAEYSLRKKLPGMAYTWTSRGPTIDGDLGVSVCAPGAAITSVPNFTLRNAQLLNGTSMSAPHVAGAICLLLSGLHQRGLQCSPYIMKRTLENTARFLDNVDPFAQGHGLLQTEQAFESLVAYNSCPARDVRFTISCGPFNASGIHIRTNSILTQPFECNVTIEPNFKDTADVKAEAKINFRLHLALICDSDYVKCPAFLDLQNLSRSISIKIDPQSLPTGVYFTKIRGFDTACVEKGPLFIIPITIVQPCSVEDSASYELNCTSVPFKPNVIQRHFVIVPEYATYAVLRMRCREIGSQGRFVVHGMQIKPRQSCKGQEFQKMLQISSHSDTIAGFQLKPGVLLELVVAKYWASIDEVCMDYTLTLHGVKPDTPCITMQAVDGLHQVDLRCLSSEEISPIITLRSSVQVLRPTEAKIAPLSERDIIPVGRQIYELVLTYEFHISKAVDAMPNCPVFSDVLYESEMESQLWLLFNSHKELIAAGDAYPNKYIVKIERGDYVLKLQIRHEKKDLLEKLTELTMLLSKKLSTPLSLDVYCTQQQAIIQGKKLVSISGTKNHTYPIIISPFCTDKSKLSAYQGHYLNGTITYAKDEIGKRCDVYPFKFVPFEPVKRSSSRSSEKDKTKLEEYHEALRDLKTSFLSKLGLCTNDAESSDAETEAINLYEELKATHPDHLAIHSSMMQYLDPLETKKQLPLFVDAQLNEQNEGIYKQIISIADNVIQAIDMNELLKSLAIKTDQRPGAAQFKSAMDRQKAALIDAISRKGIALCRLYLMDKTSPTADKTLETIKETWSELLKFVDPYDLKVTSNNIIFFVLWHATVYEHYGRVLKFLMRLAEEKSQKEIEEKCSEVCNLLQWKHCVRYITKSLPYKYPVAYRPF